MKLEDYEQGPFTCAACYQAGVSTLNQRRDPRTGAWLHSYDLRRWYEAREKFLKLRASIQPKGMPK